MSTSFYIIDTSCLTQAHRVYYPYDIAPSFWDFMKQKFLDGSFIYTNKVADEIERGKLDLPLSKLVQPLQAKIEFYNQRQLNKINGLG